MPLKQMLVKRFLLGVIFFSAAAAGAAFGQAGRRPQPVGERAVTLSVVATRSSRSNSSGDGGSGGPANQITARDLSLYDNGIEQTIQSFSPDPSPTRIVLLVDNSLTLRTDVQKLALSLREFAYEIYEGDQLLTVGYDEQAEIISDWTDDAKKVEAALSSLRKRGEPHLFDAFSAVIDQALRPTAGGSKQVIVVIGDGLDRGSKTRYADILAELQSLNIAVYALQVPDRTGGALRRDRPKPTRVIDGLTEGTGGRVLSLSEPREAAKSICDELRNNRYVLGYSPVGISYTETRRLLLVPADENISVRFKTAQPAR